ncbi:MAG: hypothetical protein SAK29_36885 [Scytonema sp. PMC 1069.18]|nr:hypothetical protein [Scytonema sp. PMC 1069.18]MEC4883332.1 hypothetical protein [Scytonema sp. PMC 1070.18]
MALLNRLLKVTLNSAVVCLTLTAIKTDPVQAALFKFNFISEEANGYFVYDTSVSAFSDRPGLAAYLDAVVEYKIDLGERGLFQGSVGTPIVFLLREEYTPELPESDGLELEVRGSDREPQSEFTFLSYFYYPKSSFGESIALPNTVPNTARLEVYPNVNFPITRGESAFIGTVQTKIEKIPESVSVFALLGVSAWFTLTNRQCRQYWLRKIDSNV